MDKQTNVKQKTSFSVSGEPFPSVQSAWFWFSSAWQANQDGARFRGGSGAVERPCEPLDILCVVDRLVREKQLTKQHLKVMTYFGSRGTSPRFDVQGEKAKLAYTLWADAMHKLETVLVHKGIVSKTLIQVVK